MRWRLGLRPRPRWGACDAPPDPLIVRGNAPSALATLYFMSIFTSQFPFWAPPLRNFWIRHCLWSCRYRGSSQLTLLALFDVSATVVREILLTRLEISFCLSGN